MAAPTTDTPLTVQRVMAAVFANDPPSTNKNRITAMNHALDAAGLPRTADVRESWKDGARFVAYLDTHSKITRASTKATQVNSLLPVINRVVRAFGLDAAEFEGFKTIVHAKGKEYEKAKMAVVLQGAPTERMSRIPEARWADFVEMTTKMAESPFYASPNHMLASLQALLAPRRDDEFRNMVLLGPTDPAPDAVNSVRLLQEGGVILEFGKYKSLDAVGMVTFSLTDSKIYVDGDKALLPAETYADPAVVSAVFPELPKLSKTIRDYVSRFNLSPGDVFLNYNLAALNESAWASMGGALKIRDMRHMFQEYIDTGDFSPLQKVLLNVAVGHTEKATQNYKVYRGEASTTVVVEDTAENSPEPSSKRPRLEDVTEVLVQIKAHMDGLNFGLAREMLDGVIADLVTPV
jgi:hypothetical protein